MIPSKHALMLSDNNYETSVNLMFRCGPCDICGGKCLCLQDDKLLIQRIISRKKPVGSFAYSSKRKANKMRKYLESIGICTYMNKNIWNMWIVFGTCTKEGLEAFCDDFINENMSYVKIGHLYGYPPNLSKIKQLIRFDRI